jgi:hypothetical protein
MDMNRTNREKAVVPSTRTRSRLALGTAAALAYTVFAGPIYAAAAAKPSTPTPQREKLTISPEEVALALVGA